MLKFSLFSLISPHFTLQQIEKFEHSGTAAGVCPIPGWGRGDGEALKTLLNIQHCFYTFSSIPVSQTTPNFQQNIPQPCPALNLGVDQAPKPPGRRRRKKRRRKKKPAQILPSGKKKKKIPWLHPGVWIPKNIPCHSL